MATAIGTNEIRLEWTVPSGNGRDITGYLIQRWLPNEAGTDGDLG